MRPVTPNKSRSVKQNDDRGYHAERQMVRWPKRSRRYKKWQRAAARCGRLVFAEFYIRPPRPVELVRIGFKLVPGGVVFSEAP